MDCTCPFVLFKELSYSWYIKVNYVSPFTFLYRFLLWIQWRCVLSGGKHSFGVYHEFHAEIHRIPLKDMLSSTFTVYAIAWLSDSKWSRRRTGTPRDSCKEFTEATVVIHVRCRIDMTRTPSGMLDKLEFPPQYDFIHTLKLQFTSGICFKRIRVLKLIAW